MSVSSKANGPLTQRGPSRFRRALERFEAFFLKPASARPLAALRICLAIVLLVQAYLLHAEVQAFFAHDGIMQEGLARYFSVAGMPRVGWLVTLLQPWGLAEASVISGVCVAYVIGLGLLLVGLFTRPVTIGVWFLHWMLMNSAYSTAYGVDLYAHVFLFYLMFSPSGRVWSVDAWLRGAPETPSPGARLALRLVQLHLCITYLASAIEKGSGAQWWNGELLWRALSLPVYKQFDFSWLAWWPHLSMVFGWTTLLVEGGYFIFIWPRETRPLWIVSVVALHFGIIAFLGLGVFGSIMCLLSVAVFGVSEVPADGWAVWRDFSIPLHKVFCKHRVMEAVNAADGL